MAFQIQMSDLESISLTFYELLVGRFPYAKELQTRTVITEKLLKTLSCEKVFINACEIYTFSNLT